MTDAERYIQTLTRVKDGRAMFCWKEDKSGVGKGMQTLTCKYSEIYPSLVNANHHKFGIFCLINESAHHSRRRKADICNVRAIWADLDGVSSLPQIDLEPSMVVQTRNGYHIYYILESGTSSIAWGEGMNKRLAQKYGGDPRATDACRVLRVPGFWHHKADPPVMTTLLACSGLRYTREALETALGAPERPQETSQRNSGARTLLSPKDSSWGLSAALSEKYKVERAPEGSRNHQLATSAFKLGQIVGMGELTSYTAEETLLRGARSNGYEEETGEDATRGVIRSALSAGAQRPRPKRGA